MPDTTHWIVVRDLMPPYEIDEHHIREHLNSHGECVYLIPGRVWRDYQQTVAKLKAVTNELKTYRRATLVIGVL